MDYLYLIIAIISEIIATIFLKEAPFGSSKIYQLITVVIGYTISFISFSLALKTIPISIAYSYWSGLSIVSITIIEYFLYHQKLDTFAILGITIIIIGILIINLLSTTTKY